MGRNIRVPKEYLRTRCLRAPALDNLSASRQNNANLTLVRDSLLLESARSVCQVGRVTPVLAVSYAPVYRFPPPGGRLALLQFVALFSRQFSVILRANLRFFGHRAFIGQCVKWFSDQTEFLSASLREAERPNHGDGNRC